MIQTDKTEALPLAFTKRVDVSKEATMKQPDSVPLQRQTGTKTITQVAKENTDSD